MTKTEWITREIRALNLARCLQTRIIRARRENRVERLHEALTHCAQTSAHERFQGIS